MLQDFIKPRTVDEAVKAHDKHPDYFYIAGGSEILSRGYPTTPEKIPGLIDLSGLGLNHILLKEKTLRIEPLVTLQELADSPETEKPLFDIMREAALNVSNRNIRNRATVGGNIAACKSCSDIIPLLLVMEAELDVAFTYGKRAPVPILEYVIRGEKDLITAIRVSEKEQFFMGIRRYTRTANDLALVNVCLGLKLQDGKIKDARLAIGGMAAIVMRIPEAEQFLTGKELAGRLSELAPTLRACVEKSVLPLDDHRGKAWFKRELAGGLTVEALYKAAGKGGVL